MSEIVKKYDKEHQKLVDLCFQVGMMMHGEKQLQSKSRDDAAEWIGQQLRDCGFDTSPCGLSWGVLKSQQ